MAWIAFWTLVVLIAAGVVVRVNDLRFRRKLADAVAELGARRAAHTPIDRSRIDRLPPPVRRYLNKALEAREYLIRSAHFLHSGTFRPRLDGRWFPIRGREYVFTEPLGFIWWGRLEILPGFWVDAIDRFVRGLGSLKVTLASSIVVVDASGPAFNRGELLRVLSEMPLYPTLMLDSRYVAWTSIDERHARARLRMGALEVHGVFEFSDSDMPIEFVATRERDLGGGKTEMTPWSGRFYDFRMSAGVRVPHRLEAAWHVAGKRTPYARFQIDLIEFDRIGEATEPGPETGTGDHPGLPSMRAANRIGV